MTWTTRTSPTSDTRQSMHAQEFLFPTKSITFHLSYSYIIGGDGTVFEGRGWNKEGDHTDGFNSVGYAVGLVGTFTEKNPTDAAQNAYFDLVEVLSADTDVNLDL